MYLFGNGLTGPIPAELGKLSNLRQLFVYLNRLTGPIPIGLADLGHLEEVRLGDNLLTGPIPAELGALGQLRNLSLRGNGLAGPIPAEIGRLSELRELDIVSNNLTGSLPPEIGSLMFLRDILVADNRQLSGPLPRDFTRLHRVEKFTARDTGLCLPADSVFQAWIETIPEPEIADCPDTLSVQHPAYLTQAVQSRERPVPLVSGRSGLLRVSTQQRGRRR